MIKGRIMFGKTPLNVYEEDYIVASLLRTSPFDTFYANERANIRANILWTHDPSLPIGVDFRSTFEADFQTGEIRTIMRLRKVPAHRSHSVMIAHELTHLIVDQQGYKGVGFIDQRYENLLSALSSAFLDVLVDSRLLAYKFDLVKAYKEQATSAFTQARNISPPTEPLMQLLFQFNTLGLLMEWGLVRDQFDFSDSAIARWLKKNVPFLYAEAEQISVYANKHGFATPDKLYHLFFFLIQRYKMEQICYLPPPTT